MIKLLLVRCTQDLDDLDQLVGAVLALEDRFANEHLAEDAANRPGINGRGVVRVAEDQLRGTVVAGADVRDIRVCRVQLLGTAEIADLENSLLGVDEEIVRFDVTMADVDRWELEVGDGAEELEHEGLDEDHWHWLTHLEVVSTATMEGLRNEFHHDVEEDFFRVHLALRVVVVPKSYNVRVTH